MLNFVRLVKEKGFAQMSSTVCATGGGAEKYAKVAEEVFNFFKICIFINLGTWNVFPQIRRNEVFN